jgi:hypothetical protein
VAAAGERHPAGPDPETDSRAVEEEREAQAIAGEQARALAEEQARDVLAGLRTLGCKVERARSAVEHCMTLPACSLEDRMRAALAFLCPKTRVRGGVTALE